MKFHYLILAWNIGITASVGCAENLPWQLATLEYPPYIINTDQGPQGLTVEVVRTAFARMGQPVKIDTYPIARGQQMLLKGAADGFFSIKKTPEREKTMLFAKKTLMQQDYVFFVLKGSRWQFNGDFASMADARVGIVYASSFGNRFDAAVKAGLFSRLDSATDYLKTFKKLLTGRVDAVICSRLVGLHYLSLLNGLNDAEVSGPVVETTVSYLAFTKKTDHINLARQFDQALEGMEKDGTLKRLSDAYHFPRASMPARQHSR